jgi:nicotinamidase-related amidase
VTSLDTNRTALLVMDYQPALLAGYPNADALIDRTAYVISQSRAAGIKIIYIRVAFTPQDYTAIPAHNKPSPAWPQERGIPSRWNPRR